MGIAGALGIAVIAGVTVQAVEEVQDSVVRLRGSPEAMVEQHQVALDRQLPFFQTREEITQAVQAGQLVELAGGPSYEVADFVDLPYAIAPARVFVERIAEQYQQACGEPLVVTSGVRAIEEQPPNAHDLSVHPAGMAVDLRVSGNQVCRDWLEERLLALEAEGVVNGTREFNPPHYHIAIYPARYTAYVAQREAEEEAAQPSEAPTGGGVGTLVVILGVVGGLVILYFVLTRRRGATGPDAAPSGEDAGDLK